jgi:hypothetical protein
MMAISFIFFDGFDYIKTIAALEKYAIQMESAACIMLQIFDENDSRFSSAQNART